MVIDWLASGVNPAFATLFVQSRVPEHAELHLLLSMLAPLAWLERVPTLQGPAREAQGEGPRDLRLPRLSAAPGAPTSSSIARPTCRSARIRWRTSSSRASSPGASTSSTGASPASSRRPRPRSATSGAARALYREARRKFVEQGDQAALEAGRQVVEKQADLTVGDRERLLGYLEGAGRSILVEPQALLTPIARMPGLDGQKMSKSYGNTIELRDEPDTIVEEAAHDADGSGPRAALGSRRAGEMSRVGVPQGLLRRARRANGCRPAAASAGIGCIECKQKVIDKVNRGAGADPGARARTGGQSGSRARRRRGRQRARPRRRRAIRSRTCARAMGLGY